MGVIIIIIVIVIVIIVIIIIIVIIVIVIVIFTLVSAIGEKFVHLHPLCPRKVRDLTKPKGKCATGIATWTTA